MAKGVRKFLTNDQLAQRDMHYEHFEVEGDITADTSFDFLAPFDGRFDDIGDIFFQAGNTGSDGTDPLNVKLDVLIDGTSIFSTLPQLNGVLTSGVAGAADGANTLAAGTGITVGVLKALASRQFSKGDPITVTFDVTRTTPEDEAADLRACVGFVAEQDRDPDMTVAIAAP